MNPPCEALLDQDRYIGGDPVGHACYNQANFFCLHGGLIHAVCESCFQLVWNDSPRISFAGGWTSPDACYQHLERCAAHFLETPCKP